MSSRADSGSESGLDAGLYVVSTPIGNMGDVTQRAIDVLAGVDVVACEDTRRTGLLLKRSGVSTRMVSYHEHNKLKRTPELLEMIRQGRRVALVSDAGTPGVSDPGFHLIRAAVERSVRVVPVPGASALLAALVVSGLPCDRFAFEGFLPKRAGRRRKRLQQLAGEPRTMVFFEPARRIKRLLGELAEAWGEERSVVIGRELTKRHEEVIRGRLGGLLESLQGRELKGEAVVVVEGAGHES